MVNYIVRIVLYTVLPVIAAGTIILADRRIHTHPMRIEIFLIYVFGLGVAGSGIGNAIGHLLLSDIVAESIGWQTGSPFQLEMGFANLALGVLGLIAAGRRDGFREATVIAVTVIGLGATVVHVIDIIRTGNLSPGNTVQNVINLVKPALLIGFLAASRRAEADGELSRANLAPYLSAVGFLTGLSATGFAVGFAIQKPVLGAAAGVLAGSAACAVVLLVSSAATSQGRGSDRN